MIVKLFLENGGFIIGSKWDVPPNPAGGSRMIYVTDVDDIWTGSVHLWASEVGVQTSVVEMLETRSSLNEDDEPWHRAWTREGCWSYEQDHALAHLLEMLR
jgi:hypothetical protein